MIEMMPDLPDNVVGFTARGKVTEADYESHIVPAIEEKLKHHKKIRLLYHLGEDFEGFEAGAMWDDAKVGLKHIAAWEKIAMVSDVGWINGAVKAFGFVMPGEVKTFANSQLSKARDWVSDSS